MAEDKNDEAIWFTIELPRVIGLIGPKAIEFIEVYINDPKVAWSFKIYAVESLVNIIKKHPESREDGIAIIEPIAANYASNDIAFNACLLKELAKINATELSSLAMRMLEEGWVDFDFVDNEAIEKVLG